MWGLIYVGTFLAAFLGSAAVKMTADPFHGKYTVDWDDSVGTVYTDLAYGDGEANRFDLYVPAGHTKEHYGLIVYLYAGGFTSGDKRGDAGILKWLCAKGYVTAGINYTLFSQENPTVSVYSQTMDVKNAMPHVVAAAEELGYPLDRMAVAGGSAGGTLALVYAYRDAGTAPIPVKMVFEMVGPASSADRWIDERSVPALLAYGKHDKVCPILSVQPLIAALEANHVPYDYFEFPHSGHGLQNDNRMYAQYMEKLEEYLARYMGDAG